MAYGVECIGATSVPVASSDLAASCASAGGTLQFVESASILPELTLADGGLIAGAIIALWALGFCLREIQKMVKES